METDGNLVLFFILIVVPTESPCTPRGPQYFALPSSPHCYIQCLFQRMLIKPCPNPLVWNQRFNICDWPTVIDSSAADENFVPSSSNFGNTNSRSASSYLYGRTKRSTTERKKLSMINNPFPSLNRLQAPIGK